MIRVQIYTNDREQPIDLTVKEMRARAREINTNEHTNNHANDRDQPPVDHTMRQIIKDPTIGVSANLLFVTEDGREGAIYLNTEKVAAVVTSWWGESDQTE